MFENRRTISNSSTNPLDVLFEPMCTDHSLAPGEQLTVVGRSPHEGQLEVIETSDGVAVYSWPGSTLQVFNGDKLVYDFNFPVPDLPPDMSTRSFVEFMFGGLGGPNR